MFGKKCSNCKKRISQDYEFCPHCGSNVSENSENPKEKEDYGLLGKNDDFSMDMKMPFGFNTLFNSLVKELDKQFKELDKTIEKDISSKKVKKSGISISISSFGDKAPEIKIKSFGDMPEINQKKIMPVIQTTKISDENVKKLTSLPRKEASTQVRRLSNKVVYEINLPGVKSLKNIFVNQLENSIEVKAIGKDQAYFKLIPVSMPLKKYSLKDEKLVLELDVRE